jgi:hypothetical protein
MRLKATTLAIVLALASPAWAIVTSDEAGSHVVVPGQPAFGINLDGVALVGRRLPNVNTLPRLSPICSAALISDRHLLCAAHCFDEDSDGEVDEIYTAITHTAAFELADGVVMVNIDPTTIQFPENWPQQRADIAVVTLEDVAPHSVPRYPLYGGRGELGRTAVFAGYGVTGHGATGSVLSSIRPRAKRAGLNRPEGISVGQPGVEHLVVDFDSGQAVHNTMFSIIGIESDLGFGVDEVLPAPGDSGGPMFIGQAIAGVHAFGRELSGIDPYDSDWGELNFESRVSYFRNFLETATGGTAVFVPEPATPTISLLAFAPLVLLYRARHLAHPGGIAFANQKTRASIRHATALLVWAERCLRSHRRKTPLHAGKLREGEGKAVAVPFVLKSQALPVCTDTLNRRALREQRLEKSPNSLSVVSVHFCSSFDCSQRQRSLLRALCALCGFYVSAEACFAADIRTWAFEATIVSIQDPEKRFGDVRLGDPVRGTFSYDVSLPMDPFSEPPQWADYSHPIWFQGLRMAIVNPRTGEALRYGQEADDYRDWFVSVFKESPYYDPGTSAVAFWSTTEPPPKPGLSSLVYMEFLGPSVLSEITLPTSFDIDDWPIATIYIDTDNIANGAVAEVHSITPITPGDFTLDGKVDSDDYGLWQSTYGPTGISEADWDRNGAVDTADYVTWRNSVSALSASASNAAVPEPASVQLAILVLLYAAQSRIIRWREPRPAQHGH